VPVSSGIPNRYCKNVHFGEKTYDAPIRKAASSSSIFAFHLSSLKSRHLTSLVIFWIMGSSAKPASTAACAGNWQRMRF
jgi:hypothetical protein